MQPTILQAVVTKTAAFNGASFDISGITGDWELGIRIHELKADSPSTPVARFSVYDSVDAFANQLPGPHVEFKGPLLGGVLPTDESLPTGGGLSRTFKPHDFPGMRFGVTNAVLRVALDSITGTNASVTFSAWIMQ